MKFTFINETHESLYHQAKELLDAELLRQRQEAERLQEEWKKLPEDRLRKNVTWMQQHFAECRRPYEKILTDIISLCPMAIIIDEESAAALRVGAKHEE
jgi:hypothetical protein